MSIRPSRPRVHAGPTDLDDTLALLDAPDVGDLPRHLRRPGPDPHNAGITPGWRHLITDDEPATRRQLRRALRRLEREAAGTIEALAGQVAALQREVMDLRRQLGGRAC